MRLAVAVVDDETDIRSVVAWMLRLGGHEPIEVDDPERLLDPAAWPECDAAIIDWHLGGQLDGGQLLAVAPVPCVVLTAFDNVAPPGGVTVLVKPVNQRRLLDAVEAAARAD